MKLSTLKRGVFKKIIGPIKYAHKDGYLASFYWKDRLKKYGFSLQGTGHEGLSEEENRKIYNRQKKILEQLILKSKIDLTNAKILDVGCGSGFFTQMFQLREKGKALSYTGLDITNVLFERLQNKYPSYRFLKGDISSIKLSDKFDLILIINVIQHIVNKKKLNLSLTNIKHLLKPKGVIILGPIAQKSKSHFFYLHDWSLADIQKSFFKESISIKDDFLIIESEKGKLKDTY